jgi:transcriptional regulator with XRE-family HTH domain
MSSEADIEAVQILIGKQFFYYRHMHGKEEVEIAKAANISLKRYKRIEAGQVNYSISLLISISRSIGIDWHMVITTAEMVREGYLQA